MLVGVDSALRALLAVAGATDLDLSEVEISGNDPVLATRFRVGEAAALALRRVGRSQLAVGSSGRAADSRCGSKFQRLPHLSSGSRSSASRGST